VCVVAGSLLFATSPAAARLRVGSSGHRVKVLQRALRELSYPTGPIDGLFGYKTWSAVVAWEKVNERGRNGIVGAKQLRSMGRDRRPQIRGRGSFVKVNLTKQVLFLARRGRVVRTIPVSTGSGDYYKAPGGSKERARTPRGRFAVVRKIKGWRKARLGRLYYPAYFHRGVAIHGSRSVPVRPASHGCVRVPMYVARWLFRRLPVGFSVRVVR
jgi:lipoprotein-anchoring transpeptidase ErfK/SrfK